MTKIAFFDVDGTMINVPHQLLKPTDKTIHALKEFQKQGNYIVVASARGVKPECLDEIPFDGFIGCDGGYIEFHQEVLLILLLHYQHKYHLEYQYHSYLFQELQNHFLTVTLQP